MVARCDPGHTPRGARRGVPNATGAGSGMEGSPAPVAWNHAVVCPAERLQGPTAHLGAYSGPPHPQRRRERFGFLPTQV